MFGTHLVEILRVATLATVAFAFWKGELSTRIAAVTTLGVAIVTFIIHPKFGDVAAESILLAVDFVSAVIFLLLAVRYASLWLGATMLLQAAQFSLHAYYLVMELPHDLAHAWINNLDDWGILISIVVGTLLAIRKRATDAREEAERETMRQKRSVAS